MLATCSLSIILHSPSYLVNDRNMKLTSSSLAFKFTVVLHQQALASSFAASGRESRSLSLLEVVATFIACDTYVGLLI